VPNEKELKRRVRERMVLTGDRYTDARSQLLGEAAYLPEYGFRVALSGVRNQAPVRLQREGREVVLERLLSSAEGTEVVITLAGLEQYVAPRQPHGPQVHATLQIGTEVLDQSSWGSSSRGGTEARLTFAFPPLPAGDEVTVFVTGEFGDWQLVVPLVPAARNATVGAFPKSWGSRKRHHVELRVLNASFDPQQTAVQVGASADPPVRFVRGIAAEHPFRYGAPDPIQLTDELGNTYEEASGPPPSPHPQNFLVVFQPSAKEAQSFKLSVPWVAVSEAGETPEVSLADLPITVPFGRYRIRLLGWSLNGGRMAKHYPVRIHFRTLAAGPARALVMAEQIFIDGQGVAQSLSNSRPCTHVDVQSPTGAAPSTIVLKAPLVRLNGPWDLNLTK